jgi:predicted transcriptional regulator YheO
MDGYLLDHLKRVADATVAVFGSNSEVVVHDFSDVDHSVVHVAGDLTGRDVGAPISLVPYRIFQEQGDAAEDLLGYKNITGKGRVLKCSTVFVRDGAGKVVGCYSINIDVSEYMRLATVLSEYVEFSEQAENARKEIHTSVFPETVETVIDGVVSDFGKAPSDMSKEDRMKIVGDLERAGAFMYKGAVQYVADSLGTSRYTIYGYLRENKTD